MILPRVIRTRFPEELYPPCKPYEEYLETLVSGYNRMACSSVSIGMLVRDNYETVRLNIDRCLFLSSLFGSYNIHIFENDSKNANLIDYLRHISTVDGFNISTNIFDSEPCGQNKSLKRRVRMACYRNKLKRMMCSTPADFYIVLDSDIAGGFSYDGIANSVHYQYDCSASNGLYYDNKGVDGSMRRLYYDSWAYREYGKEEEVDGTVANLKHFERGLLPISVFSAFGGMAIYNSKYFPQHKYVYDSSDCDHVTLHKKMRDDGAEIYINPNQIVLYNETFNAKLSHIAGRK